MFDTHLKYGLDERGPYSAPDVDATSLMQYFPKSSGEDQQGSQIAVNNMSNQVLPNPTPAVPQTSPPGASPSVSSPGSGNPTPGVYIPGQAPSINIKPGSFSLSETIPNVSSGYVSALKELLGSMSNHIL